jgi:hypothetical protein
MGNHISHDHDRARHVNREPDADWVDLTRFRKREQMKDDLIRFQVGMVVVLVVLSFVAAYLSTL